ncbi:phosphoglycerate mutase [Ramaria rubella]|nr:phosphoglycerate mutase [Ramaria rubella]
MSQSVLPGVFSDTDDNDGAEVEQIPPRFGRLDSTPTRWNTLKSRVEELNKSAPSGTTYRLLFVGRHGQGFHNVAESLYGSTEWNREGFSLSHLHMATLNGDENMTWGPDPKLTELGLQQAKAVNKLWHTEIAYDIPLPESLYSSPFSRAVHTALITFDGILLDAVDSKRSQKRPLIKEKLREVNGVHTCDKRSTRSYLETTFPQFDIEPSFTEKDELWRADHRETEEELTARLRQALDEIFIEDSATYISITAHGGAIRAILRVITAAPRHLPTGG